MYEDIIKKENDFKLNVLGYFRNNREIIGQEYPVYDATLELDEYGLPEVSMYQQYLYLHAKYYKWYFAYGVLQPQDGGCLIFALESRLERYPLPIRNFIKMNSEYEIYTLYEVRQCDYCDNYILLHNVNFYNIENKYVCLECFAEGTYKEYMYDNVIGIVDHMDDISPYISNSNRLNRNRCVR